MHLLYKEEHEDCPNYNKVDDAAIDLVKIGPDHCFEKIFREFKIIVLVKGSAIIIKSDEKYHSLDQGIMMLLPSGNKITIKSNGSVSFLLISVSQSLRFCDCFTSEHLNSQINIDIGFSDKKEVLYTNQAIDLYIESLHLMLREGLQCKSFFDIKIKELFLILRAFYTKEELNLFFKDILNNDIDFFQQVMQNYQFYRTATELASGLNMTIQSLERRFKSVFGMPPYRWMNQQRTNDIYRAICSEDTPLKELAARFGFASKSSFSEFCRKQLGDPPGKIRKIKKNVYFDKNHKQNVNNEKPFL